MEWYIFGIFAYTGIGLTIMLILRFSKVGQRYRDDK